MAFMTALCVGVLSVWLTWRTPGSRAAAGLFATGAMLLALALTVSLLSCGCSVPLRADTLPDVRFALMLAAGFGLAGVARLLVKSGA
ncbi:hypothetical protein [Pseudoduganella violaceinigra]|uniref:hypothetical protein n=1 Tax=Pseudoduganella violaceinigra TaxID=246602 RepID=UPI0003FBAD97|nr:hypothetical protein [Pseudoduganella violaceinigra]